MLYSAILLGFAGSLHCVGMCGPIAFMLPLDRQNSSRRIFQLTLYHLGRLLSYGLIGLLFGLLGKGLYLFGLQQKLSIWVGIIMIGAVVLPFTLLKFPKFQPPFSRLLNRIKNTLGKQLKSQSADAFLSIGILNGLLPCGLVYMALIGAIAMGEAGKGVSYMLLFGLGTIPLMSVVALFGKHFQLKYLPKVRRFIPIFVVMIGLLFILRGLGLGIPYLSPADQHPGAGHQMECAP